MVDSHRTCARILVGLAFAAGCVACGDASFTTRFASDYVRDRHVVSVLGVYRDGRMSSDAWGSIGPKISAALGAQSCNIAYAEPLVSTNGTLWSAIDDYARANGPTDDLLVQLAPAAKGDLILVLTLAGKVRAPLKGPLAEEASAASSGGGGPGGGGPGGGGGIMGGRGAAGPRASRHKDTDTNALDFSASVFSVARGHSVALVSMEYSGSSADEAITLFSAKLARELRGTTCAGWSWDAPVDAAHIRQMIDP
jgi:hypothetical protein